MKLYLVQHAKAASKELDPQRGLTQQGRAETEKMADFLRSKDLKVTSLWHSGKTRAHQTAEIIAGGLIIAETVTARDGLSPNDDITQLAEELNSADKDIMIVGHLPFLEKLATLLVTGNHEQKVISFINSGVVCLKRAECQWSIEWAVTPELAG